MHLNVCRACNSLLLNRRPQTTTCNAACRARAWRQSRITMLPVSIMLSLTSHTLITKAASAAGVSINDYLHNCAVQVMDISQ